jgi:hypothetical protein
MGWGMVQSLTERYEDRIAGVLCCYDRLVITGTVPVICYTEGMTRFLYSQGIRIFDYPQFAQSLRDRVREGAASLAAAAGIAIEHIGKSHVCKEEVVARVSRQRADHPGLVHIISDGGLRQLPALARQDLRQDLRAAGRRQVPALLFLLHGCRPRVDLPAGAVPPAILLQRPQLAGTAVGQGGHRPHHGG